MSKKREIETHIYALNEIHGILESMRNLAMMEVKKLAHYHETQQRVVDSIDVALADARRHFMGEMVSPIEPPVYLVFGSERGFCGAYNEQLYEALVAQPNYQKAPIIAVGSRLAERIQRHIPSAIGLPGAAVADEVGSVLAHVIDTLVQLRQQHHVFQLHVIHFKPEQRLPVCNPVIPAQRSLPNTEIPPLINLPPEQLIEELFEHYLFAVTREWFYSALTAENQRRVHHLEEAGQHIQHQLNDLGKRRNVLRQEEIIEEIEVILLSSEAIGSSKSPAKSS